MTSSAGLADASVWGRVGENLIESKPYAVQRIVTQQRKMYLLWKGVVANGRAQPVLVGRFTDAAAAREAAQRDSEGVSK